MIEGFQPYQQGDSDNIRTTFLYPEFAFAYYSIRLFGRFVNRVESRDIDLAENPYIRLQLFELADYYLNRLDRDGDQIEWKREVCGKALNLALARPEYPDSQDNLHFFFITGSYLFRYIDPYSPLSTFTEVFERLVSIGNYLEDETMWLIIEDNILAFSYILAPKLYDDQLERARDQSIHYAVYAMSRTGNARWGRIFVNLFLRASSVRREALFPDEEGDFERKEMRSIREVIIGQAYKEFSLGVGRVIAGAILAEVASIELEYEHDIYWIPLIGCSYENEGTRGFIRFIFHNREKEIKLDVIRVLRDISRELGFQAEGFGKVYFDLIGELISTESDREVGQALAGLQSNLARINQEDAQRELLDRKEEMNIARKSGSSI